jgi:hypothetical protein
MVNDPRDWGFVYGDGLYCEHRDVIFLTEVAGSLRDRFGRKGVGKQDTRTRESIEFAFFAASFGNTVGVERQAIAFPQDQFLILEFGFSNNSQRERFVEREFIG